MSVVFAALMVLALLPIPIRVTRARRSGRPVHLFDDVVSQLTIPIFILAFVLPLSRAATNALIVVFTVITVISLYRLFRGLGSA